MGFCFWTLRVINVNLIYINFTNIYDVHPNCLYSFFVHFKDGTQTKNKWRNSRNTAKISNFRFSCWHFYTYSNDFVLSWVWFFLNRIQRVPKIVKSKYSYNFICNYLLTTTLLNLVWILKILTFLLRVIEVSHEEKTLVFKHQKCS